MIENNIVAEIYFDETTPDGFRVELADPKHIHCLSGCEQIIKALLVDGEENDDPLDVRIFVSVVKNAEYPFCISKDMYVYTVVNLPCEE